MDNRRFRLFGIPILSLLIVALANSADAFSSLSSFAVHLLISLLFTTVLWLGTSTLWAMYLRKLPRVEQTARRLWSMSAACVLYTAIASTALVAFLNLVLPTHFSLEPRYLGQQIMFNLIPTTVVMLVYESRHFFLSWEQNVRRAEQLQSASQRAQLEALQQQLDPHFLFNTLNTLSALIEPENEPAQQFVEQLADVYRYVLLSRERSTVSLREELTFVEAYVALQKARLRDNLQVEVHIPAHLHELQVAPLSVQLLIENALKHNEASRQNPLRVQVTSAGGWLMISNARRARTTGFAPPSMGMGLRNIRERYALLTPTQTVQVDDEATMFTVRLPLLPTQLPR
jgi:sensor histidine kinase YesM